MSIRAVISLTICVTVWMKVQDWVSVLSQLLPVVILCYNKYTFLVEEL